MTGPADTASKQILQAYARAADVLSERLEAIDTARVLAPVAGFVPPPPARVLDVGAGTGRDAGWFAARGFTVCAAEPVEALRQAACQRHDSDAITWLADGLPQLHETCALDQTFDLILVNAVWHHLHPEYREEAMEVLGGLLAPEGRLILSLREGPTDPDRPVFAADVEGTIAQAGAQGLRLLRRSWVPAVQPASARSGVIFTWLVFAPE